MPRSASLASAVLAPVTTASFDVRATAFDRAHRAGQRAIAGHRDQRPLLLDRLGDQLGHRHRQRMVARDHLVDLVPRVADDELPLLRRHLRAVPAHRQHDRFDVLALAVDQRAVEVEQECVGGPGLMTRSTRRRSRRRRSRRHSPKSPPPSKSELSASTSPSSASAPASASPSKSPPCDESVSPGATADASTDRDGGLMVSAVPIGAPRGCTIMIKGGGIIM